MFDVSHSIETLYQLFVHEQFIYVCYVAKRLSLLMSCFNRSIIYNKISSSIEAGLLPFQRDGVRYAIVVPLNEYYFYYVNQFGI